MTRSKKKMTAAQKAAARVPDPAPVVDDAPAPKPAHTPLSREETRSRRLLLVVGLIVLVILGFTLYTCNYSHETEQARAALDATEQVFVENEADWIAFGNPSANTGYVLYPGGKVAAEAYAPIAHQLADKGVFCVIVKVPFNLAFFKTDAADAVLDAYPQVGTWYVGGHSLGGVAACQWAQGHADKIAGIILLASYPSVDLSGSGLRMLSIYGSNDQVMNRENYVESHTLRPGDFKEVVIEGGNHAQFGEYGTQDGDGEPTISAQEQRDAAVDAVLQWIG